MMIIAAFLFGQTYLKIRKLSNREATEANKKELLRVKRITGVCFFGQVAMSCIFLLGLYTQGYYGPLAAAQNILTGVTMTFMELCFFIITVKVNLDLTLQTKVLQDGQVVLIGMNKQGIEKIKLYLNPESAEDIVVQD